MTGNTLATIYLIGIPLWYAIIYAIKPEWKVGNDNSNSIIPLALLWPATFIIAGTIIVCAKSMNRIEKTVDWIKARRKRHSDK